MLSEKIEKIMKSVKRKQDQFSQMEYGVVGTETVFFTDRKLLIANNYPFENVYGYNAQTDNIIFDGGLSKKWYDRTIPNLEKMHKVELHIPELFYKVVRAFKSPALIKKSPRSLIYDVTFSSDNIAVTEKGDSDMKLTFSENYRHTGKIKVLPMFNLYYLFLLKPSHVFLYPSISSDNLITMSILESYDKAIRDFNYILLSNSCI